jgi:putative peptidoglycan lipid II flippase
MENSTIKPTPSLFKTSLMIAGFLLVEKLLGFTHNLLVARQFSLSPELDAFNVANNLPQTIFGVFSGAALGFVLVPALSAALLQEGRPSLWQLFSRVLNLVFLITASASLLSILFAEPLVRAQFGLAPGFDPSQQALVVRLMRLNLLATLLFSLAGLMTAGLHANQRFFLPAFAPAMYDLGILFGVLVLAPSTGYQIGPIQLPALGLGIQGLMIGTILGGLFYCLVQLPGLLRLKFRWSASLGLSDSRLQQVILLALPRMLTVMLIYLVAIIQDNLASRLVSGSVTSLVFAWLIFQAPVTLIGTALGSVLLPTLASQHTLAQVEAFKRTVLLSVRFLIAVTLPVIVVLCLLLPYLVGVLGFNTADSQVVVQTTSAFLLGLTGYTLVEVGMRAFYARQKWLMPLAAAAIMLFTYTLLAIPLSLSLGAPGLGLANALAYSLEAAFLLLVLDRQMGSFLRLASTFLRALGGACMAALIVLLIIAELQSIHFPFSASYQAIFTPGQSTLAAPASLLFAVLVAAAGLFGALPLVWRDISHFMKA